MQHHAPAAKASRCPRIIRLLAICLMMCSGEILAQTAGTFDALRRYLESDSAVEYFLVKRENPPPPKELGSLSGATVQSTRHVFFEGAYSGSDFILKALKRAPTNELENLSTNTINTVSRRNERLWWSDGKRVTTFDQSASTTNVTSAMVALRSNLPFLSRILKLGFCANDDEAIKFDGAAFEIVKEGQSILRGEFSVSNGIPLSAVAMVPDKSVQLRFAFDYVENPNIPWFHPTYVTVKAYSSDGRFLHTSDSLQYISLRPSQDAIPGAVFDVETYTNRNNSFITVTNGQLATQKPDGGLRVLTEKRRTSFKSPVGLTFAGVLAALMMPVAFIYFRKR